MKELKVFRFDQSAKIPSKAYHRDAGLDLYALHSFTVDSGMTARVATGIGVDMRDLWPCVGLILERSSLAAAGLRVSGGVIDSGYLGEISVLMSAAYSAHSIRRGTRIAQLVIVPTLELTPMLTSPPTSPDTLGTRGTGGFGSSGNE